MTGSAPVAVATVDQRKYRRGARVNATVTVTDADNRVEDMTLDGTDPGDNTTVHDVDRRYHSDIPHVTWRYQGTTAPLGTGLTLSLLAPARSVVLEAVVVDAQGHTVVASVPLDVQTLALGVDADTTGTPAFWLAELNQVIAGKTVDGLTKLFQPTGLPNPTKYAVPAGMIPNYTAAQMPTRDAFTAFVQSLAGRGRVWLSIPSEMDRKLTLAAARTQTLQLADWMDGAPEGVELVPSLTGSWQENHNANRWSDWMFTHRNIKRVGLDLYVGGQSGYRPIGVQLDPAVQAANAAGLIPVVLEFGVVVPPGATAANFDERAAWIPATLDAFDEAGVESAGWWNAPPSQQQGSFRLASGDPGWDALRERMPA